MAELVKLEIKSLPELLIVGREIKVLHKDVAEGRNPIPAFWNTCFEQDTFGSLEAQKEHIFSPDYVGFMCDWNSVDGMFSYVVGMLMKPSAAVPDGYAHKDVSPCTSAVAWVRGENEGDVVASAHALTEQGLKERGLAFANMQWCMELYNCPRFTTPDEQGRVTLDYYIPLDC